MKYFTEKPFAVLIIQDEVCIIKLYAQIYCAGIMEDEKLCCKSRKIMISERECWPFTKKTFAITI